MVHRAVREEVRMKGFTLLEVVVAAAVFMLLILIVGQIFDKSSDSLEYFTNVGGADTVVRRVIDLIAEDIQQAQPGGISITPFTDYDAVTIVRARGETGTETVSYTVNGNQDLVRIVSVPPGPTVTQTVVAHNVDSLDASAGKGFAVSQIGTSNLYQVTLRLKAKLSRGDEIKRAFTTTVGTRS